MRVTGVILAAGASSRMRQPKQLLDWGGRPLVRVVVEEALAAPLDDLLVVTGGAHAAVARALAGLPVRVVYNPDYAAGQSTSLRAGIAALGPSVEAALVLLGDQPFVTAAVIGAILAEAERTDAPAVAPSYRGRRGNPVLFRQPLFSELTTVEGDQGARGLLARLGGSLALVAIDDDRPLIDIDTPEEYARVAPRQE
jgi:molybdenum cofactor cytidylyltransferase